MWQKTKLWIASGAVLALLIPAAYAGNQVLARIDFDGKSKVERDSGVWVDGGYVGYLKELKGSKQVLLLPGEHTITVRQDGYQDFTQEISVQPGQKYTVRVVMQKALTGVMPKVTSTVKLDVNPPRAAVFVDGLFIGHAKEFEGLGHGMLVAPGPHKIKVSLPGYQTFETEINAVPRQKVEVKTNLMKAGKGEAYPAESTAPNPPPQSPPPPSQSSAAPAVPQQSTPKSFAPQQQPAQPFAPQHQQQRPEPVPPPDPLPPPHV